MVLVHSSHLVPHVLPHLLRTGSPLLLAPLLRLVPLVVTLAQLADKRTCRVCGAALRTPFLDLGSQPLANSYLRSTELDRPEPTYPLRVFFCRHCLLVQAADFTAADQIFDDDYAYFSSYSQSWLEHARAYVDAIVPRLGLSSRSRVIEIASNDGYLLQYFAMREIPVLGVEPSTTVARAAIDRGIPTWIRFFGAATAREIVEQGLAADLVVGNNVLAHVPDLHDFVAGVRIALKPDGVATFEFPHVMQLLQESQFDTVYHEHFSYFSALVVVSVFAGHGLRVFDVEELPTHGGSLRVWARHAGAAGPPASQRLALLLERERHAGLESLRPYRDLDREARRVRKELLRFLDAARAGGKTVVGYGAPAKGNTLLNFCGVSVAQIPYTVDANPHKQGRFLPGTHIPIHPPDAIRRTRPDYVLILPWNLKDEIMHQMADIASWGGRFVTAIPALTIHEPALLESLPRSWPSKSA